MQSIRREAQDGLRGFCRDLDDILMTGAGRLNEFSAVMTLSLSGVYAAVNTSRVLKVFAAIRGSFFLPAIWLLIVPTLCVGMPLGTLCVQ
ncbi:MULTISPECIES: hypothetical protein [unclassified Pseudomonas]|uniref:hypothetical protein n=1 Tax=Pseudomonas sp. Irchel s3h9 TaxID=2009192 RepID=UPI0011402780|nr:hypothetical protein [Pseudomonas sp. Irchel s3h9]